MVKHILVDGLKVSKTEVANEIAILRGAVTAEADELNIDLVPLPVPEPEPIPVEPEVKPELIIKG